MGKGYLTVSTTAASEILPVSGVRVQILEPNGQVLYDLTTDNTGQTSKVSLYAPNKIESIYPQNAPPYSVYDIMASAPGYEGVLIRNARILDTSDGFLKIDMIPLGQDLGRAAIVRELDDQPHWLVRANTKVPDIGEPEEGELLPNLISPIILPNVIIPQYITVHLGRVTTAARNIQVAFRDYVKNVAENEIYNTWHEEAIKANIYCIVSFTLNRIYTEYYRSRGYAFDITSTTHMDHQFNEGTVISSVVSRIVDNQFNQYIAQIGHKEPFLSMYCDGIKVKCPGQLTQWGSQNMALSGMSAQQIIRASYAYDLEFRQTNLISNQLESYPGYTIQEGYSGEVVRMLQEQINRIASSIGTAQITNVDGIYGPQTVAAVKAIQKFSGLTQDGRVGKQTWNEIQRLYAAVRKLTEMDSEGEYVSIGTTPPTTTVRAGQRGELVARLQFLINFISVYDPYVPFIRANGLVDSQTVDAIKDFQRSVGLTPDGIVGAGTWRALYNVYWGIQGNGPKPPTPGPGNIPSYPGYALRNGSSGSDVTLLQTALAKISSIITQIPSPGVVDGRFGNATESSVRTFQSLWGLAVDGVVGLNTWNAIMTEYYQLLNEGGISIPPYPGYFLRNGSSGSDVTQLQTALAKISSIITQIPSPGVVDGKFGNATESSVRTFQSLWGLTVDGVVGPSTWDAIMAEYYNLSR